MMSHDGTPWVLETTDERFAADCIERSHDVPVVVDFWAEWCGPCRMLGPTLAQLAGEFGGRFLLVKAEMDVNQGAAAGLRVEAIPAVFALRDGQIVDQFVGLLPEPQLRAWIERILPQPAEVLAKDAAQLESTAPRDAEAKYREALRLDANLAPAKIGLARLLVHTGQLDEAGRWIADLRERGFLEPEAEAVEAELALRAHAGDSGAVDALRAVVVAEPDNGQARLDLAQALAAAGQHAEALELCLRLVQTDRKTHGDPARETMVNIFHLLGPDHELVSEYRRRLSAALY
ncbi:MAG: tetratricopeptide repeat protein [Pirellulales bacterium]|nr:tetratricopeptide repeat protein [Pirellulales bacterium]